MKFCKVRQSLNSNRKLNLQKKIKQSLFLYAITDRHWLKNETLAEQVEKAILGGTTFIQLREKNTNEKELYKLAKEVQFVCKKYKVPFVINDNVELAKKINADGVHIGQNDMNAIKARALLGTKKIIGVSAQTVEQALLAEKQGADYLGVGAIFSTTTKQDANNVSFETLKKICQAVKIPVVAIGGITAKNIIELKGSGIAGISVISAIFAQPDIIRATKELKDKATFVFKTNCEEI